MTYTDLQKSLQTLFIWLDREYADYITEEFSEVFDFTQEVGCTLESLFANAPISAKDAAEKMYSAESHVVQALSNFPELKFGWELMFKRQSDYSWFIGLIDGDLALGSLEAEYYDLLRLHTDSSYEDAEARAEILETELEAWKLTPESARLFDEVVEILKY